MKAMVLKRLCSLEETEDPLEPAELPKPDPGEREVLLRVLACGVCHTELDEIEGRTPPPKLPIILGHQAVGRIDKTGDKTSSLKVGDRVGVAWVHSACGQCKFCMGDAENLCAEFRATGRDANGGYAQYMTVPEDFAFHIPEVFSEMEAAPLLCAGAIGYRSLRLTGLKDGQNLGLTGFGASAHLVLKMARHLYPRTRVYVFARNQEERAFSKTLGAAWAGDTTDVAPEKLDSVIDTTPVWKPIVEALKNLTPGGRLVVNAIRKKETDKDYLQQLDYTTHLWMEKEIKSVANVTRRDVSEFLALAAEMEIKPEIQEFALEDANKALMELKTTKIKGAKVLKID